MEKEINDLSTAFGNEISGAKTVEEIENVRIKYFGKKGLFPNALKGIGALPPEKRSSAGKVINEANLAASVLLEKKKQEVLNKKEQDVLTGGAIDTTLPGKKFNLGRKHPVYRAMDEIKTIFVSLGFSVADGPEIETVYYNFTALNMPLDHPARDMWSTLYIDDNLLLRTHTSPVQIRVMEKTKPPLAIIAPGKCYRRDAIDASHSPMFHQVEGLLVDEGVRFSDLKGVIGIFVKRMFSPDTKLRFRPSYFPFTEPSAEADIRCLICAGKGCQVCKGSGWLEILGAGMVHPEVFRAVKYDTEKYTGFAFGMGVERIAMLKYGIDDMRLFFENDIRFLEQF